MDQYISGWIDGRAATAKVVRDLHNNQTWIDGSGAVCGLCFNAFGDAHPWPCPTIKAIDRWVARSVQSVSEEPAPDGEITQTTH
jgi:hypothetical protein